MEIGKQMPQNEKSMLTCVFYLTEYNVIIIKYKKLYYGLEMSESFV